MESLDRIYAILKSVALAPKGELRLTDIANISKLNKSTVSRIKDALLSKGFLKENKHNNTFSLGSEIMFLGLSASRNFSMVRIAKSALLKLAENTEDTAYLTIRSGDFSVCVDRVLASYPIKTATTEVGDQHPLGIGAGSLAILSSLTTSEIEDVLRANSKIIENFKSFSVENLLNNAKKAAAAGYAYTQNHRVQGVTSLGVAIRDPSGKPIAAISVAAVTARFANNRKEKILTEVMDAAKMVEEKLCVSDSVTVHRITNI